MGILVTDKSETVFPTLFIENGYGGGKRQLEVQYNVGDLREIEISIDVELFGASGYDYMYLDRDEAKALYNFLKGYVGDDDTEGTE